MLIKYPKFRKLFSSLFEFNVVRLQKLLHMSQNAILTAIFCFYIGVKINSLFKINKDEDVREMIFMGLLQMIVVIISIYYIRKLTMMIPFVLRFTESYDPFHKSVDGEGLVGASVAMGLLLMTTQLNMRVRIHKMAEIQQGQKIKKIDLDIMNL